MTTPVKMTPLLRSLVATRYLIALREREIISTETEINWESLSKFFEAEQFHSTTEAVKLIWDLVDAIPILTKGDNIDTVKPRKGRL